MKKELEEFKKQIAAIVEESKEYNDRMIERFANLKDCMDSIRSHKVHIRAPIWLVDGLPVKIPYTKMPEVIITTEDKILGD